MHEFKTQSRIKKTSSCHVKYDYYDVKNGEYEDLSHLLLFTPEV